MNIRKILVLAGEESGLIYAEGLKDALQAARPGEVMEFRGYQSEGFKTADLAVMGLGPVLRRIFFFIGVLRTMRRLIRTWRPEAVVTIDYPDLNLKLARYAKSLGIPAVHIVCPQVWAWRQKRIPKVAAALTKLLCFLPFEPPLFAKTGLAARFIGHPLMDIVSRERPALPCRDAKSDGVRPRQCVAILPGSRIGEIQRILPRLLAALHVLAAKGLGNLEVSIPAANGKARAEIDRLLRENPPPAQYSLEVVDGKAREILRKADCAAVASGTATLEAALVRCPAVVVYAVSPVVAWFLRRMIKGVKHAGLANVIAEKSGAVPPMPELLQEAFTPQAVASQLEAWLSSPPEREKAVAAIDATMKLLKSDGAALGNAAREVLDCI